jgi:TM2 domain-containing membrane protein YozV
VEEHNNTMTPYAELLINYLPAECRPTFAYECRHYGKDPLLAFLLQIFGGLFGVADFYLGNVARGVLMLVGTFSGLGMIVTVPIWLYKICTIWFDAEAENDAIAYALAWRYFSLAANGTYHAPEPPPPPPRPRPNISGLPATRPAQ